MDLNLLVAARTRTPLSSVSGATISDTGDLWLVGDDGALYENGQSPATQSTMHSGPFRFSHASAL